MLNSINCFRHKTRLISSSVAVVISIAVATFATYSPSASTASYDAISSLPDLGGSSSKYLSPSQAKLMGKAYIRQARRSIKFINDPLILNYINTLGQKIAKTNPDTTIDFEFYVVANPQFNAFAVPSGQIVVHSGLLESTESEGELAAVLAHEIAHVTQNHIARRLELSRYDNLFALAAVFAAAASGDSDSMQAAVMAGQGSAISRHLRYSRGFEREADALGIRSLALAGYEPHAAVSVLHKLRHAGKFNSTQAFEFLLSHPLTDSRISNLTQRSKTLIAFTNQALKENSPLLTYAEFKARVNALYGEDRLGTASRLEAKLADSSTPTLLYQYAVNQQRNQQFNEAVDSLRLANRQSPEKFIYQLALAEALVSKEGSAIEGKALFNKLRQKATTNGDESTIIDLYYGYALLLNKDYAEAIPLLKTLRDKHPEQPDVHIMLSRAFAETKQLYSSYVSRAEYHYLRGNFEFAIKQIDNALSLTDEKIQRSILLQRRDDIKRELKQVRAALS